MNFEKRRLPNRTHIFIVLFTLLLTACATRKFTVQTLPVERIAFGSGGGVTGKVDTFLLLKNGQLFLNNSLTKETQELEGFEKSVAVSFFGRAAAPSISGLDFKHPGNFYRFLEYRTDEKKQRIVWPPNDPEVPETVQRLYRELMQNVKKHNP